MASLVSHIIYAKKYLEKFPSATINRDEFILGCVFPDIRRIDKNISRKETHLRFDPADLNFENLPSFEAGWKFHLYCDMKREEILNKYDFFSLSQSSDFHGLANKLLEDTLIYTKYNNWEKLEIYFNNFPKINLELPAEKETIDFWYAIISKYIEKIPDQKSMHIFLSKQPSLSEKADNIIKSVESLRKNKKALEILEKVSEEIV